MPTSLSIYNIFCGRLFRVIIDSHKDKSTTSKSHQQFLASMLLQIAAIRC